MLPAIEVVDNQTDRHPADESVPVGRTQFNHHVPVERDTKDRNEWHKWCAERSWTVWVFPPQYDHRDADDHEGEQGANIHHLANGINRCDGLPTMAARSPARIVPFHGVRKRGWIAAKKPFGSRPSLAIE
jgi:hypothetical protein